MKRRSGITRCVLLVGGFAIKVPKPRRWKHFIEGLLSNMQERDCWAANVSINSADHLAPVLWASWGGWVLVMERTEPIDPSDIDRVPYRLEDHKAENYGVLRGNIVCIDYA